MIRKLCLVVFGALLLSVAVSCGNSEGVSESADVTDSDSVTSSEESDSAIESTSAVEPTPSAPIATGSSLTWTLKSDEEQNPAKLQLELTVDACQLEQIGVTAYELAMEDCASTSMTVVDAPYGYKVGSPSTTDSPNASLIYSCEQADGFCRDDRLDPGVGLMYTEGNGSILPNGWQDSYPAGFELSLIGENPGVWLVIYSFDGEGYGFDGGHFTLTDSMVVAAQGSAADKPIADVFKAAFCPTTMADERDCT